MRRPVRLAAASAAIALLLALGACGSDGADDPVLQSPDPTPTGSSASASPSASPSDDDDVKLIEISMSGSTVEPPPGNVKVDKGEQVRIVITRDTDGEVHVHGYDEVEDAKAGEPVTFEFVADRTGVFEVEAHEPDRLLTRLQVR